jgi:peroxiredoxin
VAEVEGLDVGDPAPDLRLHDQDGVEHRLSGRTTVGVIRSSVRIGTDGRFLERWRRARAASHAHRALRACSELLV